MSESSLSLAMPVQAAAAEAAKLCPHGINVLINSAGKADLATVYGLESMYQCSNRNTPVMPQELWVNSQWHRKREVLAL